MINRCIVFSTNIHRSQWWTARTIVEIEFTLVARRLPAGSARSSRNGRKSRWCCVRDRCPSFHLTHLSLSLFSTWCCKNGNPAKMKVITTTFIRWEPTGQTQSVVVGHDSCGFGGWSKCTVYGIQHVYVTLTINRASHQLCISFRPTSHIDYGHELVPDLENSQCPQNSVVCCKSMIPVAGFCMSKFSRSVEDKDLMLALLFDQAFVTLIVWLPNGRNYKRLILKPPWLIWLLQFKTTVYLHWTLEEIKVMRQRPWHETKDFIALGNDPIGCISTRATHPFPCDRCDHWRPIVVSTRWQCRTALGADPDQRVCLPWIDCIRDWATGERDCVDPKRNWSWGNEDDSDLGELRELSESSRGHCMHVRFGDRSLDRILSRGISSGSRCSSQYRPSCKRRKGRSISRKYSLYALLIANRQSLAGSTKSVFVVDVFTIIIVFIQ